MRLTQGCRMEGGAKQNFLPGGCRGPTPKIKLNQPYNYFSECGPFHMRVHVPSTGMPFCRSMGG